MNCSAMVGVSATQGSSRSGRMLRVRSTVDLF
jgi:hypothetical protein